MARYPARHGYRRGAASLARLLVSHAAPSLRRRLGSACHPRRRRSARSNGTRPFMRASAGRFSSALSAPRHSALASARLSSIRSLQPVLPRPPRPR
jgi:hypothetical protein